jgi:2-oxoglutarate ferredoxin oxidoreductase subunit alpha
MDGAKVGLITYGSSEAATREARVMLDQAGGLKTDLLRIRALPYSEEVIDFIKNHERVYIIEANRDGQMRQILSATLPEQAPRLRSAAHSDGLPLTARWVKETILAQEEKI